MEIPIREINYGIAYQVTDGSKKWIEMNKYLKDYPKLYKSVLTHEMKHFKSKNKHMDFMIDFKDMFNMKNNWEIFKFTLNHPRTLLANSPILFDKGKISFNWFMVMFNLIFIGAIVGGIILI